MNQQVLKINDMPRGWAAKSKLNQKIYNTWRAMLERTTEKYWQKYPTYRNTTVDESWRTLSNFAEDIKFLPGYEKWSDSFGERMMLDKDILGRGNKHYSKETCCFVSQQDSNRDVWQRHPEIREKAMSFIKQEKSIPVKLINKTTNEIKFFDSMQEACRELNLNLRHVWTIVNGKPGHHSTKGWIIEHA